jgi:hypothetical protein
MTELTLTIPRAWWMSANQRLHWAEKGRRTRNVRRLARITASTIDPVETVHIAAFIGYLTGGRADPANAAPVVKAAIDGLVDAGVIADDDHTHVIGPTFLRDPKSPTPGHYTVRLVLTPQKEVPW